MKNESLDSDVAGGGRQWTWQTCVEFGYFQSSASALQPFGNLFPASFSTQQCEDIYGVSAAATAQHVADTNAFYGGLDYNTTRVIFVNGDIDPWHALSLGPKAGDPLGTTSVRIHGTAHCANMYPASPNDVAGLTAARHSVSMAIEDCKTLLLFWVPKWLLGTSVTQSCCLRCLRSFSQWPVSAMGERR